MWLAERGYEVHLVDPVPLHIEPQEIVDEIAKADLEREASLAIEGPAWLLQDLDEQWRDDGRRAAILRLVRALEAEPSMLGVSSHIFFAARRRRG